MKIYLGNRENIPLYKKGHEVIIALEAEWRECSSTQCLMEVEPQEGKEYFVNLQAPLHLDTTQDFWLVYTNPFTQLNGVEDVEGVNSFRFCKVVFIEKINQVEYSASLKVKVLSILPLKEIGTPLPQECKECALKENEFVITYSGEYIILEENVQSLYGMNIILQKIDSELFVIAYNKWTPFENYWVPCKEKLSKKQLNDLDLA